MYFAGFDCITSIGSNAEMTFSAIRAGLSGYKESDFICKSRELAITSHINDDLFLQFFLDTDYTGAYSVKMDRASKAMLYALNNLEDQVQLETKFPLIWLTEEPHNSRKDLPMEFLKDRLNYFDAPVNMNLIYRVSMGRASGIVALELAEKLMHESGHDYVLIGGVECPFHPPWLEYLDERNRLKTAGAQDAFVPGEAAAFLLLCRTAELAEAVGAHAVQIAAPAWGESPAHWYNEEPDSGETLHKVMQLAIANGRKLTDDPQIMVDHVLSSMNGESFWAKEYGVAVTRLKDELREDFTLLHPFEFTGDLGCVSGLFLLAQGVRQIVGKKSAFSLVYASSDNAWRSSVCLLKD